MATLNWIGKEKVINHHLDVPFRTLKHKYTYKDGQKLTDGTKSENKIIHGDNLEALKSLLPEYEGKVKCIYIDPPYNTGNEGWVYNDNVNHPKIKKWLGQVVGKEGEDLTRHDKWLCMMYPRLKLLHKLLDDSGFIFISIDDNEIHNLKLISNEIFGQANFIASICWEKSDSPRMDAQFFSTRHDYILVYSKNIKKSKMERIIYKENEIPTHYNKVDQQGRKYYLKPLRAMGGQGETRESRPTLFFPIKAPDNTDVLPKLKNGSDGAWRWSKDRVEENINLIEWVKGKSGWNPYYRIYADNGIGKPAETIFYFNDVGSTRTAKAEINRIFPDSRKFDTPKPLKLIQKILELATDKESIVLDSFAGSGTTAHAVLNLNKSDNGNRKFILVELEDYANDITALRIERAINGYGSDKDEKEGIGGDFEFLELGDPLFNEDEYINENQSIEDIRKYVYYSETRTNTGYSDNPRNEYYLGKRSNTAYYFYYKRDKVTTLDLDFASGITIKADQYIVYADKCTLSESYLNKHNIIFKKIPRDITRI